MYKLPNGRVFALTAHTPSEWGTVLKVKLLDLGCSDEYAVQVEQDYANAEEVLR